MKNNVKTIRKAEDLTQKELSSITNISERNLQAIEAGVLDPRTSNSLKLAKALNTTVEQLFAVADNTKE